MSSHALREGFREVLRDPALLLIELGWRWSFAVIAVCVCAVSIVVLLGSIPANAHRWESLFALPPLELAQVLASGLVMIGFALIGAALGAGLFLTISWIVLSSIGRRATLTRSALAPGASLQSCFAIHAVRAAFALTSMVAWFAAAFVASRVGGIAAGDTPRVNIALMAAILLPTLVLILTTWTIVNWYLSLATLFAEQSWSRSLVRARRWCQSRRDELLEIGMITGTMRGVFLGGAIMLSIAVSTIVSNPRVMLADLLAIALLYFFAADLVYVARLAAYAKLRHTMKSGSVQIRDTSSKDDAGD